MNRPAFSARSVLPQAENTLNAATSRYQVVFNSVPEQETTWRAATFRLRTCGHVEAEVEPGTEPAPPFGAATPHVLSKAGPAQYRDVSVWFEFTASAVGTAPQSHGPVNTTVTEPAGPGTVGPGPRRHLVRSPGHRQARGPERVRVPVEGRARLWADVTHPDGARSVAGMTEAGGGVYEVSLGTAGTGVYRITVRAEGGTFRGVRFTREALLTAAVWPGGDRPDPDIPHDSRRERDTDWCHLVECLVEKGVVSRELQRRWLEYGVDLDRLRECVKETCTR